MEKTSNFGEYCGKNNLCILVHPNLYVPAVQTSYSSRKSLPTQTILWLYANSICQQVLTTCLHCTYCCLTVNRTQSQKPRNLWSYGPFHRFLNLPCKAQKPLLLLALHHEKLLLFPVYILRVITGVNTKWNTKIELHEKILSSSSGYSKVVFLGVCSGLLLPCKTLIQFFNGPCF